MAHFALSALLFATEIDKSVSPRMAPNIFLKKKAEKVVFPEEYKLFRYP